MEQTLLNMTIGPNFGNLIVSIAREKIFYNLDPKSGLDVIKNSLIGCSNEMAIRIIRGDIVLITSDDGLGVDGVKYEKSMEEEHPRLDAKGWAERTHKDIISTGVEWRKCLNTFEKDIINNDGFFHIDFTYKDVIRFIENGDFNEIIKEDEVLLNFSELIRGIKNFLESSYKKMQVIRWLFKIMPVEVEERFTWEPCVLGMLYRQIVDMSLEDNDIDWEIRLKNKRNDYVGTYIKRQREIDSILSNGIEPVNIRDKYDAGWLSPEGDYYALNGEVANMLHNQIADALKEKGVIPDTDDKYKNNPDYWLEQHGWVKIHGKHILFSGYEQVYFGSQLYKLTDIQIEKIYEYGMHCCPHGVVEVGCTYKPVNVIKLKQMDEFMLAKLFSDF